MTSRERCFVAVAVLVFALGLVASLALPRVYVAPMAVTMAVGPVWVLIFTGVSRVRYLIARRRYERIAR